jgi:hypothetical protein
VRTFGSRSKKRLPAAAMKESPSSVTPTSGSMPERLGLLRVTDRLQMAERIHPPTGRRCGRTFSPTDRAACRPAHRRGWTKAAIARVRSHENAHLGEKGSAMAEDQGSAKLSPTEARQATKEGVVRYVLAISLVLVIAGFLIAYFLR